MINYNQVKGFMGGNINGSRRGHVNVELLMKWWEKHNWVKEASEIGHKCPHDVGDGKQTTRVLMMIHLEEELPEYQQKLRRTKHSGKPKHDRSFEGKSQHLSGAMEGSAPNRKVMWKSNHQ
jgi:hypothetical protein